MKKKLKNILIYLLLTVSFIYSLESLFLNVNADIQSKDEVIGNPFNPSESKPRQMSIVFGKGLFAQVSSLSSTLSNLQVSDLPSDGKLDKTIDLLERGIALKKVILVFYVFLALFSLAGFFAFTFNTWFHQATLRGVFFFTLFPVLSHMLSAGLVAQLTMSGSAFFFYILNLTFLFFLIAGLIIMFRHRQFDEMTAQMLYIAANNDEESNPGKIIRETQEADRRNGFFEKLKISMHFVYIILAGFILGNLVYIPLFSLQKHYSSQFGILLFVSLIILMFFYIRNYYKAGKDEEASFTHNIAVSFSFLQYRIIRNIFLFFITSVGVIIFVISLFLLLTFNTSKLKDMNVIERTINL